MTTMRVLMLGATIGVLVLATSEALAQCFVDSQAGNDSNDGLSEATPVQSQSAVPSSCTEVRYARGSVFNEPLDVGSGFGGGGRTVFTSYGDPNLPKPAFTVETGSVVSSFGGGITIDGLLLAGSRGDGTMENLIQGVCVMLGGGSQLLNSEITECDIGIMLMGDGSLVQGNVIHDLRMAVDSTNPDVYVNSVGGAEGIFINGSNNEIAYNTFYNCRDVAAWTGGNCDGGATEVAVSSGGVVENVRVHHNLSYNNCGFFEVSGQGIFRNSEFYYNVSIDSGWMFLLQVNETTLDNISWTNNTIVHHPESETPSISMIYQGSVTPGTVSFTNNLVIFDRADTSMATVDENITQANNLIVTSDPGVIDLAGVTAEDFDLVAGSQAIDGGQVTAYALDYLNRTVPDSSGVPDIGAFEYGTSVGAERPDVAVPEGAPGTPPGADPGATNGGEEEGGCACVLGGRAARGSRSGLGLLLLGVSLLLARRRPASAGT